MSDETSAAATARSAAGSRDAVAAGDVEIDVVRARSARRNAPRARPAPSTAAAGPSRRRRGAACRAARARPAPGSRPAPAACLPCRQRPPRPALWRCARRGTARTGWRPRAGRLSDISKTPISSVGPKRFFTVAQDAEVVAAFALEIEHGVDHVLDDARAGDLAFLGDVADQHDRRARRFGVADHRLRRGAHLRHRARRRIRRCRSTASGSNRG